MADFFKGLAGGFGTGLQLGQQLRQRRQEDELAKAYAKPEEFTDYTPEQMQEIQRLQSSGAYDVQAVPGAEGAVPTLRFAPRQGIELGQGEMLAAPTEIAPQRVQRYGSQTVGGQFDPMALQGLQMREAARVLGSYGDARGAAQLNAEATRMEREAKEAPLRLKGLEQQVKRGDLDIGEAERKQAAAGRMDAFNAWRSQNPQADFAAINAEVQRLGMGVEEQFKVASSLTGIGEQEFKASQQRIEKLVRNQGLDGLLKAHKESEDLDPGSHFEVTRGKGGVVSLNRVDTATGKIIQPNVFTGTEAETTAYLNKAAMSPATIIDYTMNLAKNKAAIGASEASAAKDRALAGRYSRDEEEKGLSKKVKDVETSLGRKLTEPEKLTLFGLTSKPRDEKPTKVEEAGVQYKVDGKLVQTDGMGGFISTKGILPENRPAALKAAGVSDNNLSRLIWSNDGEAVMFNNEEYDVKDKRDMAKLNKALTAYDTLNRSIAAEARLRANPTSPSGFQGARTTGLGPASTYGVAPGAPSIYGR